MAPLPANCSTVYWRPTETSLARESFNDIVTHKRGTNVPDVLTRHGTMSRLALLARPIIEPADFGMPSKRPIIEPADFGMPSKRPLNLSQRQKSVLIDDPAPDGFGSIRLGTPTFEERKKKVYIPGISTSTSSMARSNSMPNMQVRPTPCARYGYMAPGEGRIDRPISRPESAETTPSHGLSKDLFAKVKALFDKMDDNKDGKVTRDEARASFSKFAEVSVQAMFNEVDEDNDDYITFQEFVRFWAQVMKSGYEEEDLLFELDELLAGNVWVDYQDDRNVGVYSRSAEISVPNSNRGR